MNQEADALGRPMSNGNILLEPWTESHRAGLKAAIAEDLEICQI